MSSTTSDLVAAFSQPSHTGELKPSSRLTTLHGSGEYTKRQCVEYTPGEKVPALSLRLDFDKNRFTQDQRLCLLAADFMESFVGE